MSKSNKSLGSNTFTYTEVKQKELPLACPTSQMALWNMHPKVYLPIEKTGKAECPYCGANYVLIKDED